MYRKNTKKVSFDVREQCLLLDFLFAMMPDTSKSRVKEILQKEVYVDGRKTSQYNFPLQPGMKIELRKKGFYERFVPRGLDIVYEDDFLFVINKHEGLLSYSKNPAHETAITVLNKYLDYTHQSCHAHVVHRLDRDTSGLMIVAKDKKVARLFEENWKERVTDRAYSAVVWGRMENDEGRIESWLTDGEYCVLSSPVDNGGKRAVTNYKVVRRSKRFSLLELRLETGRRNQIRVQMREEQHPVVKDPMYGYKDDLAPIGRLALHAFRIAFVHPITGRHLAFETPVPQAFVNLLNND